MMILQKRVGRKKRPQLTIALDCGSLSPKDERARGGVATITLNVIEQLFRLDKRNSYIFYSFTPLPQNILSRFETRAKNRVLPRLGFLSFWIRIFLKLDKPDVFLALSQIAPKTQVPTVGFIYDVAFLEFSKHYKDARRLARNTAALIDRSRHIVTISDSSKMDVMKTYALPEKKISVFYPGVSDIFTAPGPKYVDAKKYWI